MPSYATKSISLKAGPRKYKAMIYDFMAQISMLRTGAAVFFNTLTTTSTAQAIHLHTTIAGLCTTFNLRTCECLGKLDKICPYLDMHKKS